VQEEFGTISQWGDHSLAQLVQNRKPLASHFQESRRAFTFVCDGIAIPSKRHNIFYQL
jgi:hypothetical protein